MSDSVFATEPIEPGAFLGVWKIIAGGDQCGDVTSEGAGQMTTWAWVWVTLIFLSCLGNIHFNLRHFGNRDHRPQRLNLQKILADVVVLAVAVLNVAVFYTRVQNCSSLTGMCLTIFMWLVGAVVSGCIVAL